MNTDAHVSPGIVALLVTILASALAQLLLKTGVSLQAPGTYIDAPGIWWIIGGLACYGVSLLAWIQALARLPLSYAYPLLSVSYIIVYVGAILSPLLAESITPRRTAGILLVAAGVALVSRNLPVIQEPN